MSINATELLRNEHTTPMHVTEKVEGWKIKLIWKERRKKKVVFLGRGSFSFAATFSECRRTDWLEITSRSHQLYRCAAYTCWSFFPALPNLKMAQPENPADE